MDRFSIFLAVRSHRLIVGFSNSRAGGVRARPPVSGPLLFSPDTQWQMEIASELSSEWCARRQAIVRVIR